MIAVAIIVVLVALFVVAVLMVAREARADEVTAGKRRLMAEIERHGEGSG